MAKIWAKLIIGEKIVRQQTFEIEGKIIYSQLFNYALKICERFDVPTPLILKTHIFNLAKFNMVRFKKNDFVEAFNYDFLVFEYITN